MRKDLNKRQYKAYEQLKELIKQFGYWSNEVKEFNSTLDYTTMSKINDNIQR